VVVDDLSLPSYPTLSESPNHYTSCSPSVSDIVGVLSCTFVWELLSTDVSLFSSYFLLNRTSPPHHQPPKKPHLPRHPLTVILFFALSALNLSFSYRFFSSSDCVWASSEEVSVKSPIYRRPAFWSLASCSCFTFLRAGGFYRNLFFLSFQLSHKAIHSVTVPFCLFSRTPFFSDPPLKSEWF